MQNLLTTKNSILELIRNSQAYKDNDNVDSLIDENRSEFTHLNKGIIAIAEAQKSINATIVAFQKAFSLSNSAFIDIDTLQAQIDICEKEKELAKKQVKWRAELDEFLNDLDSEIKLVDLF